ncbi:MAG: MFS transporter [Actinomycetota bacterium]
MAESLGRPYRRLFAASTISNLGDGIGTVAYPWLASAVTRDPILVALIIVAQRLPWLFFSLPAGVITDRHDRRRVMLWANTFRAVLTAVVAIVVLMIGDVLPTPEALDDPDLVIDTNIGGYLVVVLATVLLGMAEVLYDNTAQTIMPALVEEEHLERANGRLWSAEQVMNTVGGPALGAFLLAVSFALPFGIDAITFAVSAFFISRLPKAARAAKQASAPMREEIREGFTWLWSHSLLRPLAITLGLLNALGTMSTAAFVLFAQEVLRTEPIEFALLQTGGAAGGLISGWVASDVAKRLGSGPSLWATLIVSGSTTLIIGLVSQWPLVWILFGISMFFAVLWNVITVSLRQAIIPSELLGRVNSVYRFFAWGMMPIGAALGGVLIAVGEATVSREFGLRLPWIVSGIGQLVLLLYAAPRLTTAAIERSREAAASE